MVFDKPAHAVFAAWLFVRHGRENDRPAEPDAFAGKGFQRKKKHDAQTLRVQRAASPDKAAGDFAGKGRVGPLGCVGRNHVDVMIDQKGFQRLRSGDARDHEAAVGNRFVHRDVEGDFAGRDLVGKPQRGVHFIAGRIGRVELHIAAQCLGRIVHDLLSVHLSALEYPSACSLTASFHSSKIASSRTFCKSSGYVREATKKRMPATMPHRPQSITAVPRPSAPPPNLSETKPTI